MPQTPKVTRENRTITVDFNDEATYFELLSNGKAFASSSSWLSSSPWVSSSLTNRPVTAAAL